MVQTNKPENRNLPLPLPVLYNTSTFVVAPPTSNIKLFIDSLRVQDIKAKGIILLPHYNVYAESRHICNFKSMVADTCCKMRTQAPCVQV
jgi:hypothetical protein